MTNEERDALNNMTSGEAKEYFDSIEADDYLASSEFHDSKYYLY